MILVANSRKTAKGRKFVRAVLSRYGHSIDSDIFACPSGAKERIVQELNSLILQGYSVKVDFMHISKGNCIKREKFSLYK